LTSLNRVPPPKSAVKKAWTNASLSGSGSAHVQTRIPFRRRSASPQAGAFSLKQQRCPRCDCAGFLNRHSFLYGNDPSNSSGQSLRGQRVFCSNRGNRGGCGHTFSIFLADTLPRHTVTATLLGRLLIALLAGASLRSAAHSLGLPFALETLYHLRRRLRRRIDAWRTLLCRRQPPPDSSQSDPLLQTVEHLQSLFPGATALLIEFQLVFQQPFPG
jgi:hypothetical protein